MITHAQVSVGNVTPVALAVSDKGGVNVHVKNKGTGSVFLGSASVSSSNGYEVESGAKDDFRVEQGEELYAIAGSGTQTVHVIRTGDDPDHYASLTTACAGADNDLLFSAKEIGPAGNSVRVRYVVSGNSTPLTVAVSGKDITVNVATDGGGAATSTAAEVRAAVNADDSAGDLVVADLAPANDGTGVVVAFAYAALTLGS